MKTPGEKNMTPIFTKQEYLEAVSEGIRRGIVDLVLDANDAPVTAAFFQAIHAGVAEAVWKVATNGTQMPSADFYDSIKEGTENGIVRAAP
jgi:hypothetical protein